MKHDVFISYSSFDKQIADAICSKLENSKIRCWIAPRDILGGIEYGEAIINAIVDCRIVVLVFSAKANSSTFVKKEIERAISKGKIIIPFRIENILPTLAMEFALSNTHWLDAMTPPIESHIGILTNTIHRLLNAEDSLPISQLFTKEPIPVLSEDDKHHSGFLDQFQKLETGLYSDVLYFDDENANFRNDEEAWNDLLYENSEVRNIEQVILKTAYPLGHGNLFRSLTKDFRDKLTIVTSINEIRKEDVSISKGVSWEQTALDLVNELQFNKSINMLLKCKRLIITFEMEGALYIEMGEFGEYDEISKCRLIFDSQFVEDEWLKNIEKDFYDKPNLSEAVETDFMQYFSASIVASFKDKNKYGINIETSISEALLILRKSKLSWHLDNEKKTKFSPESFHSKIESKIKSQFASAFVPIPIDYQSTKDYRQQSWTILEGNYKPSNGIRPEPLFDTSFRFALYGECELFNTPCLKIQDFLTYDRHEIEELRNTTNQIDNYLKNVNGEKPFSLAVFGSSGSDKLFLVKQLAQHFELPLLDFNLTQISDDGLIEVFDQVADITLNGKAPLVYLDEFDCNEYRWIQQLLISMQSGKYNDGRRLRPIRKSVFIFSTSTSFTFSSFGIEKPKESDSNDELDIKNYEIRLNSYNDYILKKGPDFKSQISGCYLNIYGPNQLKRIDNFGKIYEDFYGNVVFNTEDIFYPLRRALSIRRICGKCNNDILDIDYGLLNALIKTRYYGPDSLEKILSHLKTKNSDKLRKSNLPATSNLNMLVSADFIPLMEEDKFIEFEAFKIARQIHNNWMKIGDNEGWKLEYHKDYNLLPAHMKVENIATARRMQRVLDSLKPLLNLRIVPKNEADFYEKAEFDKTIADPKLLERMAIEEHNGWMKTKESTGWVFGLTRNDDKKIHNCIIGWDEEKKMEDGTIVVLFDKNKHMYKDTIMHFPEVLKEAGFVIIKEKRN